MTQPMSTINPERFWKRVDRVDGACWLWTGAIDRYGYGHISTHDHSFRAHRLSYFLHHGDIDPGLHIDHLCFQRSCVNPSHLEPVTNHENILRTIRAGRRVGGPGRQIDANGVQICKNGHEVTGGNAHQHPRYPSRLICMACARAGTERFKHRHAQ